MRTARLPRVPRRRRATRVDVAARPDDLRVAPRGLRLGALRRRRARGRRDEPDRRRPPGGRAARAAPHPARRADLDRRAARARRRRRPTAGSTSSRSPGRPARATTLSPHLAGLVERARARSPTCRSTPASASRRPSTRARPPTLADGVVVGSRAVEVAEDGPDALARLRPLAPERHRRRRPGDNRLNADLLRHPVLRRQDARQLQRRVPAVRRHPGAGRRVLLRRRPALDHDAVRAGGAARGDAVGRGAGCSRRASTPTARPSSSRATCRRTPRPRGCSARSRASASCAG